MGKNGNLADWTPSPEEIAREAAFLASQWSDAEKQMRTLLPHPVTKRDLQRCGFPTDVIRGTCYDE